jgi:hypothetical protein
MTAATGTISGISCDSGDVCDLLACGLVGCDAGLAERFATDLDTFIFSDSSF